VAAPWRAPLLAALLSLAVGVASYNGLAGDRSGVVPGARSGGLSGDGFLGIPLAAQGPVSGALGAAEPAYHVGAMSGGFRAANPAQQLSASFGRGGVAVSSGGTRVALSLRAAGYGTSLTSLGEVTPSVRANRVLYARADLNEWYVNGPLGLEQGFTIARAPSGRPAGALTLSMALSGNAHASLASTGQSVTLARAGEPALRYSGLRATDAHGRALHSWLELDGGRLLLRVNARNARYPLRLDPLIQQGAKLAGAGEVGLGLFGVSVALSANGNTALIGSPGDHAHTGGAWVFTRSGSTWTQQGPKLIGSEQSGTEFGISVALSADGNTALIGGDGDHNGVGAAWVFTRSDSTWTQPGEKLTGGGESGSAVFGVSVALSADGNTALIGGSNDGHEGTGAAWVFTRSGSTWTQQGEKLIGSGACGTPYFGKTVALSADGNTALIGAPIDCDAGAAWVFTRSGSTWTQQGEKLTGGGEIGKGFFGERVALSADGNTALVGAWIDDNSVGAAWVFTRSGSTWTQQGEKLTVSGGIGTRYFGDSVALSGDGDAALIGGTSGDTGFVGAAWMFMRSGATWTQREEITGSGENVEGYFGSSGGDFGESVALSSDASTALIGGGRNDELVGGAWVFASQPTSPSNPAEYGRCLRVPYVNGARLAGQYANIRCTTLGGRWKNEWYRGVARTHFTSKMTDGVATFETVKGSRVTCSGETGTGEYTGTGLTTVGGVVLTFTGCERLGESCSSAEVGAGEIVTSPLEGVLGVTELGESSRKNKIGLDLFPVGKTGFLMQFSCGAMPVAVRGSLIVPVVANRMLLTDKLHYLARKGRQKPERFVGGPEETLEASFELEPFEQAGLTAKTTQTNEEEVEVNSVF